MTQLFLAAIFVFFFWIGYKFGRLAGKWENNHGSKKEWKDN